MKFWYRLKLRYYTWKIARFEKTMQEIYSECEYWKTALANVPGTDRRHEYVAKKWSRLNGMIIDKEYLIMHIKACCAVLGVSDPIPPAMVPEPITEEGTREPILMEGAEEAITTEGEKPHDKEQGESTTDPKN